MRGRRRCQSRGCGPTGICYANSPPHSPSKIKTHADAYRAWAERPRRHEEGVDEGAALLGGGVGAEGAEIYKFSAEGVDGLVQNLYRTTLK
jgi:hypothetical protein